MTGDTAFRWLCPRRSSAAGFLGTGTHGSPATPTAGCWLWVIDGDALCPGTRDDGLSLTAFCPGRGRRVVCGAGNSVTSADCRAGRHRHLPGRPKPSPYPSVQWPPAAPPGATRFPPSLAGPPCCPLPAWSAVTALPPSLGEHQEIRAVRVPAVPLCFLMRGSRESGGHHGFACPRNVPKDLDAAVASSGLTLGSLFPK